MLVKYSKEQKVFVTSDWHFGHDRQFIWGPRGFTSIEEHNAEIVRRHNEVVGPDDEVYVLGDLMLGDNKVGLAAIAQLNGRLHVVCGNHDTDARIEAYENLPNVVEVCTAARFKWDKLNFYCSHWPTHTDNLEKESINQCMINFFGHSHKKTNFHDDIPFIYHVGVDSHDCYPVLISDAVKEIKDKAEECKAFL